MLDAVTVLADKSTLQEEAYIAAFIQHSRHY